MDTVGQRSVGKMLERMVGVSALLHRELDSTSLGKPNHLATFKSCSSCLVASPIRPQMCGSLRTRARNCGIAARAEDSTRRGVLVSMGTYVLTQLPAVAVPLAESADFRTSGAAGIMESQYAKTMDRDASTGLLFQEIRLGEGDRVTSGERVAVDWACYTVDRGLIVQAKLLAKGGAFQDDESNLLRFKLDDGTVIRAVNEAVKGMRKGGIRRIVTVPGDLYYPNEKGSSVKQSFNEGVGPVPRTFSGKRALDSVLKNPGLIDKSIVFDVELLEFSPGGAARRAPGNMVPRAGVTTSTKWAGGKRQVGGLYQGD
eukprot:gnl/TRDRNA2_/TRDRNA2_155774_c0_seq1.p1 gnl/TRDRNA2_/TRDRNA2_155774_c0~~gnl/TRDRNA2_/TRDRNA2_155774_c0_seq1.p1  ORF type:complete len:350 (-),score=48.12 gnl/TRDRNA2_/TRDRNA2_155774_c0_seq1:21-962(-)